MWLSTSNISTARKVAVCQRECPDQPLNNKKKSFVNNSNNLYNSGKGVAQSLQMCIYDAIFKQNGMKE